MSVETALTALDTDIVNARSQITSMGGTVTPNGGTSQLASDIATIPTNSSGGSFILNYYDNNDANFVFSSSYEEIKEAIIDGKAFFYTYGSGGGSTTYQVIPKTETWQHNTYVTISVDIGADESVSAYKSSGGGTANNMVICYPQGDTYVAANEITKLPNLTEAGEHTIAVSVWWDNQNGTHNDHNNHTLTYTVIASGNGGGIDEPVIGAYLQDAVLYTNVDKLGVHFSECVMLYLTGGMSEIYCVYYGYSNGVLKQASEKAYVLPPKGSITLTTNGTANVAGKETVVVAIPVYDGSVT